MKYLAKLKKNGLDKLNINEDYIQSIISKEFFRGLKKGCIYIPDSLLHDLIKKAVDDEDGVILKESIFTESGIKIILQVNRSAVDILVTLNIKATKISFNSNEQIIELYISNDKLIGNNIIGKIASAFAGGLITNLINGKILDSPLISKKECSKGGIHCVADFSQEEQIHKLNKKLPLLNICALDIFNINNIKHVNDGLQIFGNLSLNSQK